MSLVSTAITSVASVGLLAHGVYQYQHDSNWWLYVPIYVMAAIVCILPRPSNRLWRFLSSLTLVCGAIFLAFLVWIIRDLDSTPSLNLKEGRNLLPISVAVALTASTRISIDSNDGIIQKIRTIFTTIIFLFALGVMFYVPNYFSK